MTELTETQDFSIFAPLVKVDYQKREIYGRMTQEVRDGANEVMDYASSRPLFEKWSGDAQARTALLPKADQSLGNVRLMHQPIAVGKVISIDYNDAEKAIDIGTHIADDDTWNKVLKGVLTGFSVGGKYARKWMDGTQPSLTRYTAAPAEVSVVDSPAVPTATFRLIKADGAEELRKLGEPFALPADEENPLVTETPEDGDLNPSAPPALLVVSDISVTKPIPVGTDNVPSPDLITLHDVNAISAPASIEPVPPTAPDAPTDVEGVTKTFQTTIRSLIDLQKATDDKAADEDKLKALGSRVGIARRSGEPLTPPKDYPANADEYGDPANWSWPCDSTARCSSALAYFNGGKGKDKYSAAEWNTLGERIASRATSQLGVKHRFNPQTSKIETSEESNKMELNKLEAAPLMAELQRTFTSAADMIGSGDSTGAQELLRRLAGDLSAAATATPVNPASPTPAPVGGQTGAQTAVLKADAPAKDDEKTEPAPDDEATEAAKALNLKVDTLTKLVEALVAKQTEPVADPVQKNAPIGDLAALLQTAPVETTDPVLTILMSGDKYALQKAAEAAGSNGRPDVEAVMKKVNEAASLTLAPQFTRMMLMRNYNHLNLPALSGS